MSTVCGGVCTIIKIVNRILSGDALLSGGALSFAKKVDDLFLVVALTDRLNILPNLSHSAKTVLKIDSYCGWGCTSCPAGVHLHIFPVN